MVGELERTGSGRFQTLGLIRGEAVGGGGTEEQGKDRTNCQAGRSQVGRADETYGPRSVCCLRGFAWLFSEGHRLNLFFWTFSVAQFDRIKLHTILLLLKTLL